MKKVLVVIAFLFLLNGCTSSKEEYEMNKNIEKATFAGGCFWCMEGFFQGKEGVVDVIAGYTGGSEEDPTYEEVSSGATGHYEAVQISYDPSKISYEELVELFWRQIDPIDNKGQFSDKGPHYRTAIFYHNESQKKIALESKKRLEESGRFDNAIATEILAFKKFYPAEEYHQDYYKKKSIQYQLYKKGSGREIILKERWGNEER